VVFPLLIHHIIIFKSKSIGLMLLLIWILSIFTTSLAFQIGLATPLNVLEARKILLTEKMNPLSISQQNLIIARDDNEMVGFGQIRPLDEEYSELASLYVLPEHRHKGIGSALVEHLLERHDVRTPPTRVCLLTLRPTIPFYQPFGFEVVETAPEPLQFEFLAGSLISAVLGNGLCCMVREIPTRTIE
jgi:N-acetylglutamate synthase-like GNAT family acetyltransferase